MYEVQNSSTTRPLLFFMTLASDHITGATGLSPTVTISKNGGAFGSPSGAVTEIANGWYKVAGNATDSGTNGPLALHATGTAADPADALFVVVPWNPDDAVRMGLTALPNANAEAAGGLYTRGTGAGQIAQDANGNVRVNVDTIKTNAVVNGGTITFPTNATLASTTNITAGTITTATNLTTNNDKTGYSLSGTQTFNVTGNITGNLSGSVGSVTGAVGSVTSGVTVTTNSDKTGYALSSSGLDLVLIDGVGLPTAMKYVAAATAGKSAVSGSTVTFTGIDGSTLHITATTDSNGQRTAVSYS